MFTITLCVGFTITGIVSVWNGLVAAICRVVGGLLFPMFRPSVLEPNLQDKKLWILKQKQHLGSPRPESEIWRPLPKFRVQIHRLFTVFCGCFLLPNCLEEAETDTRILRRREIVKDIQLDVFRKLTTFQSNSSYSSTQGGQRLTSACWAFMITQVRKRSHNHPLRNHIQHIFQTQW